MVGKATATLQACNIEEGSESASSSYSLRYLATYSKGASLCPTVLIQMGKETPLCLTYFVDAESQKKLKLQFFLAPRVCD